MVGPIPGTVNYGEDNVGAMVWQESTTSSNEIQDVFVIASLL